MFLAVDDGTDATQISSACDHDQVSGFEANVIGDFARCNVDLNGVVDLDGWVWVADGATVRGDQVWNLLWADSDLLHLAQLVLEDSEKEIVRNILDEFEVFVFIASVIVAAIDPDELEPNNDRIDEFCCRLYFDSIHLGFFYR